MQEPAKITCPNPLCQTANPENHRFCQQCRTPLPKRYLWAVGEGVATYKPGQFLMDRYLVKCDRIVLDTKPGFLPELPSDVPEAIVPYLRLFAYQLHVPQVYGFVPAAKRGKREEIWLLEQAPIYREPNRGKEQKPQLLPELTRVWKDASPLRQLNWLWQIAQLWQPLSSEGVASSLLRPELLRVEGAVVRLLELQPDRSTPTLTDLGYLWSQWLAGTKPTVAGFLEPLCQQMIQGQLSGDQIVAELERSLSNCARSVSYSYQIVTRTDTGPSRQRNEDACYPPSGTRDWQQGNQSTAALAIVCDGIGGHEGGNVASNLTIETIQQQLLPLLTTEDSWDSATLTTQLELAACAANDQLSQRNDAEQRQQRQRMGTTLVMATARQHEIYISHVGDSRAYWIGRTGCHQVTLDDDVASREVRLGYALYREALQQIGSGSLVQALGMSASSSLHPTVQRFVIDEDCVFLLCSDGLSDGDRVEQYWDSEILPVLDGKVDLETVADRLIEIGNTQNGHDNVTVALVYCKVNAGSEGIGSKIWGFAKSSPIAYTSNPTGITPNSALKTQLLLPQRRRSSMLPLLMGILLLLGLGGVLAYFLIPDVGSLVDSVVLKASRSNQTPSVSPSPTEPPSPSPSDSSFRPGSLFQVKSSTTEIAPNQTKGIVLLSQPATSANPSAIASGEAIVPAGSILQVVSKQAIPGQASWLRLKVCWIPGTVSTAPTPEPIADRSMLPRRVVNQSPTTPKVSPSRSDRLLQPGNSGWIREAEFASLALPNVTVAREQLGNCAAVSSLPTPSAGK